jgi:hypothetical protein
MGRILDFMTEKIRQEGGRGTMDCPNKGEEIAE